MNEYLKSAVEGSWAGIKESPRGFFAPAIAFFGWAMRITATVLGDAPERPDNRKPPTRSDG